MIQTTDGFVISAGVLTEYAGPGGDIAIPDGVTAIGLSAFEGCAGLTGMTIPEGVASIGRYAFRGCARLTDVAIPGSAARIDRWAFNGRPGLTIHAPAGSLAETFAGKHKSIRFVPA